MKLFNMFAIMIILMYITDKIMTWANRYIYRGESYFQSKIREIFMLFEEYDKIKTNQITIKWLKFRYWYRDIFYSLKKILTSISTHPYIFIILLFLITGYFVFYRLLKLKTLFFTYLASLPSYAYIWIGAYAFVIFNIALVLLYSIYARYCKKVTPQWVYLNEIPKTAIVYAIRSEGTGLLERIDYTFGNNFLSNVDLWIASGDTTNKYLEYEKSVLLRLQNKYGVDRVHYFHTTDPNVKKAQMIKLWLSEHGKEYEYFLLCDADSLLPETTLLKLLRYAEHPANENVAIFQSSMRGVNSETFYSKHQSGGIEKIMTTEVPVNQRIFGRVLFFGHNALIRTKDFQGISIPDNVLSHDIWDSAFLDIQQKRIVFCHDVITYEEPPSDFLEDVKRIGRWARGNMETIPLIFKPKISLGTRFYIFYGVYTYLVQPVFVLWIAAGLGVTQEQVWRGMSGLSTQQYGNILAVMCILFFHRLIAGYVLRIKQMIIHIFLSTVISINTILYNTIYILQIPFRKASWNPMKKNPNSSLSLAETCRSLWPGTLIGFFLLYLSQYYPYWFLISFPIVLSLVLSIPIVYLTGRQKVWKFYE